MFNLYRINYFFGGIIYSPSSRKVTHMGVFTQSTNHSSCYGYTYVGMKCLTSISFVFDLVRLQQISKPLYLNFSELTDLKTPWTLINLQ